MSQNSLSPPMTLGADGPRDWYTIGIWLWLVFALVVSVKLGIEPYKHSLYPCYAEGSVEWWADGEMYDHPGFCRYGPVFSVLFTPFIVVPDRAGAVLWAVTNIAVLVFAVYQLARHVLPGEWPRWRIGLLLTLTLWGSARGLMPGQINSLVFATVALGAVAIKRERWWQAAFLLALSVFLKVWPITVVMLMVACWPRRLAVRTFVCGLGLAVLPFVTRPLDIAIQQHERWWEFLTGVCQVRWLAYRDFWSIWEQFAPPHELGFKVLQAVSGLIVLALCVRMRRSTGSVGRQLMAILSLWVCWQLLFGPGTERNTYGLMAPIASWVVIESYRLRQHRTLATAAWALNVAFGITGSLERLMAGFTTAAIAMLPLGAVCLLIWIVLDQRSTSRTI